MKRAGMVLVMLLAMPAIAAADTAINDSPESFTHDCGTDPVLMINGSPGQITVTGACSKIMINGSSMHGTIESVLRLAVNGSNTELDVDAADRIAVIGSNNKVTYKRAVSPKKRTKVGNVGSGNRIKRVK